MKRPFVNVGLSLCLLLTGALAASAQRDMAAGRTGLPTVKAGGEKVWMESGVATLHVVGGNLQTSQDYTLHYPGPPAETKPERIHIGIRDDFYQAKGPSTPDVTMANARGLSRLQVWIDGRREPTIASAWDVNDKKDTATRWHTWWVNFRPGQRHTMRIVTEAPLAIQDGRPAASFITKDLGHWRDVPDLLDIRLRGPKPMLNDLLGLEPKPEVWGSDGVHWVYRKVEPKRDVLALLPAGYGTSRAHRTR